MGKSDSFIVSVAFRSWFSPDMFQITNLQVPPRTYQGCLHFIEMFSSTTQFSKVINEELEVCRGSLSLVPPNVAFSQYTTLFFWCPLPQATNLIATVTAVLYSNPASLSAPHFVILLMPTWDATVVHLHNRTGPRDMVIMTQIPTDPPTDGHSRSTK